MVLMKKSISKLSLRETKLDVWLNDDVQGWGQGKYHVSSLLKKKKKANIVSQKWERKQKVSSATGICNEPEHGPIGGTSKPRQNTLLSPVVPWRPTIKKTKKNASFCTLYNAPHVSIWHDVFTMQWQQKARRRQKKKEKTPLGPFFVYPHTHLCKQTQQWKD